MQQTEKTMYKFTLKNKTELTALFVKNYEYKGVSYVILKDENGKRYQINTNKAVKI
jgi:non-homologous end joining protein Ku